MKLRLILSLLYISIFSVNGQEQIRPGASEPDAVEAMADSLMQLRIFDYNSKLLKRQQQNKYQYAPDSVPVFTPEQYASRLVRLDSKTPIVLEHNAQVQRYIEMYTLRRRDQVERMLGLSQLYYPLFEEKLDKHGLPLELRHLAVVESALNAQAKSRAGAVGLWQFMYATGKMFGLETNSYVDERSDPEKSTEAACLYLKHLYKMFGDWHLALAAYNAGPGTVNKAIRRSGGRTNYWELMPYLPSETNGYVPAFIAANYIMNHYQDHNLYPVSPKYFYNQTDTVYLRNSLPLSLIAEQLQIEKDELEFLNPALKEGVVPAYEKAIPLRIPRRCVAFFLSTEDSLYALAAAGSKQDELSIERTEVRKVHVVRSGEHLSLIARKYNCSITDIRTWNNMKSNAIHPGQKLHIVAVEQRSVPQNSAPKTIVSEGIRYHTVQPGDTLWDIANKYKGVSVEELIRLNNIDNENQLKVGMKIKVGSAG